MLFHLLNSIVKDSMRIQQRYHIVYCLTKKSTSSHQLYRLKKKIKKFAMMY